MKMLLLANPAAAGGRALQLLPQVKQWCEALPHTFEFDVPANRDLTVKRARDAVKAGFDAVVVFGGDGTLIDVVEGTLGQKILIGLLPSGRGNDFATNHGISKDLREAVRGLDSGIVRKLDVATMNRNPYLNVGGVGFDSEVVGLLRRTKCKLIGTGCYLLAVLRTLITFKPIALRVEVDDTIREGRYMMAAVANGTMYGGGMRIAPDARCDDQLLDVVLVREMSRITLLKLFPLVYSGRHVTRPQVEILRGKRIVIQSDSEATVAIDGEIRGTPPAEFEVGRYSIRLIAPAG